MDDPSSPWLCGKCGYSLHGIHDNAPCPECGSYERVVDLARIYRKSNIRYACAFSSVACLIFAISLIASVIGVEPAYYGLSSWWLLLGCLTGKVFYVVGISSLANAQYGPLATQKIPTRIALAILVLGIISTLSLFKAVYDFPRLYVADPAIFKFGVYTSLAIVASIMSLPVLIGIHFMKIKIETIQKKMNVSAVCMGCMALMVVVLYFLIWLDWTVGIDLYLSSPNGYTDAVTIALKMSAILGACGAAYGFYAGIAAFRAVQ